ncbi:MAG: hypothetical protein AAF702_21185 [Chloroflexota bacterium]
MKLIIIYGSEATGKLTIAKKLAEKTEFRLFHNHVSIDVAKVLFTFGMEGFSELVWDVRISVFEHAAKWNIPGLIFTWAYSHPDFLPYLERIQTAIDTYGGEIYYVYIHCSYEELKRRVIEADRADVGKINSVAELKRQRELKNHQPIPDTDSLMIDNTSLSPDAVIEKIINHYALLP